MKRNKGFTMVEIMIVVAIIGLLAAIAIPSFIRARADSQKNACIANLWKIAAAKEEWALANAKAVGDVVVEKEVDKYIKGGRPECPAGGTYDYGKIGQEPTCSIKGHVLPVDYVKPVGEKPELTEAKKLSKIAQRVDERLEDSMILVLDGLKEVKEELGVLSEDLAKLAESVKIIQEMTKEKRE